MKFHFVAAAAVAAFTTPAFADGHAPTAGDAEAGEKAFRQCISCHVVVDDEGNTLAGKKAKTGPNLYNVAGRTLGTVEGFKYSKDMIAAGEAGLAWNEETFAAFTMDPTGYLREATDNSKARSKMTFKLRKEEDAANLYAFLFGLANPAE
ncbi:cytochrome C [Actibacterium mucosum KCTC 23349]|uniref:Cytochrome C n=1 Tax=Actibacterium mucosum KCTC 23349 TaxID=1454373 RepID=A0A037ZLY9_9RHOB|nr:c-type cytochrome [Actibacterium mucosum]KAJ57119.1 cytochrome C [Actibacterium mucosum KCTC 23349]